MFSYILYTLLLAITFIIYRFLLRAYLQYKSYRNLGLPGNFFPILGLGKDALQSLKKHSDTLYTYKTLGQTDPDAKIWVSNFGSRVAF
jgi:hypothetical protein